jgi:hypothetical protein
LLLTPAFSLAVLAAAEAAGVLIYGTPHSGTPGESQPLPAALRVAAAAAAGGVETVQAALSLRALPVPPSPMLDEAIRQRNARLLAMLSGEEQGADASDELPSMQACLAAAPVTPGMGRIPRTRSGADLTDGAPDAGPEVDDAGAPPSEPSSLGATGVLGSDSPLFGDVDGPASSPSLLSGGSSRLRLLRRPPRVVREAETRAAAAAAAELGRCSDRYRDFGMFVEYPFVLVQMLTRCRGGSGAASRRAPAAPDPRP